jgi:hypothetical protein
MNPASPEGSRAVLIGFDKYSRYGDLPAVARNIAAMAKVLTDHRNFGLPKANIRVIRAANAKAMNVVKAVELAAQEATDSLIIYYSGHGAIDPRSSSFHLVLPSTDPSAVDVSAIRYDSIRRRVCEGPSRRVVVLDCCMSGMALANVQSGNVLDTTEIDGTAVLVACSENDVAIAPEGAQHTAFTGALLSLLAEGLPAAGPYLSVADVYASMKRNLIARGMPEPQLGLRNRAGDISLGRNRAWDKRTRTVADVYITPHTEAHAEVKIEVGEPRSVSFDEVIALADRLKPLESVSFSEGKIQEMKISAPGADELRTHILPERKQLESDITDRQNLHDQPITQVEGSRGGRARRRRKGGDPKRA